jgi:trehalose 6-phosphate phosphatase
MERLTRRSTQIRAELEPLLAHIQGVELEDKQYSLAIHYRRARQRRKAREAVMRAVTGLTSPVRVIGGKLVFNILPKSAANKGIALLTLRKRHTADTAIYFGDDETDEDVFQLDQPGRLLSVRVGRSIKSAASFYIHNQAEIDDVLAYLVHARRGDKR